jgi:uncharacterized protein (DUF2249 family)
MKNIEETDEKIWTWRKKMTRYEEDRKVTIENAECCIGGR